MPCTAMEYSNIERRKIALLYYSPVSQTLSTPSSEGVVKIDIGWVSYLNPAYKYNFYDIFFIKKKYQNNTFSLD